jgi:hypothetical protein
MGKNKYGNCLVFMKCEVVRSLIRSKKHKHSDDEEDREKKKLRKKAEKVCALMFRLHFAQLQL